MQSVAGVSVSTDEGIDAIEIDFRASVERAATADHPMNLRITLLNRRGDRGTQFSQTVRTGPTPPFSPPVGTADHGGRLVLDPQLVEGAETLGEHAGGRCWRAEDGTVSYLRDVAAEDGRDVTLDADGGVYLTYHVLAHHGNGPCVPAGTYRFESDEYGREGHTWGFDLTIDDPIETE